MNSGIELSALDAGIRPADDLFRHLNGTWLATTEIPADRATAGSFMDLFDEAEAKVRAIVESSAAGPQDDEQRKIGDLYTSFMDVDRIEALGSEPLGADLALVDEVTDISGLVATLGAVERSGVAGMFGMYVSPDQGDPNRYLITLVQGGIGLPDESYYREEQFAEVRAAYLRHIERMLGLAGFDDAAAR
ncbi:MAG: peptidase M13, partial [Propionibacteriales bacterium]|nr:peptidase M13 [Propionibacteriales bacterium]